MNQATLDDGSLSARLAPVSRTETLGDQACRSLKAALRSGMLSPGERLTTRDIAATLGISLTPAREALSRLVAERVLEWDEDRTARVPLLTRERYDELCIIRLNLEGLAAATACAKLARRDLARLEALYAEHARLYAARDAKGSLRANEDFHFTIYGGAQMPALQSILKTLWLRVGPSMNLLFPAAFDAGWRGGVHHRAMLDAIAAGNSEALVRAVRRDLEEGRVQLLRILPAEGAATASVAQRR